MNIFKCIDFFFPTTTVKVKLGQSFIDFQSLNCIQAYQVILVEQSPDSKVDTSDKRKSLGAAKI